MVLVYKFEVLLAAQREVQFKQLDNFEWDSEEWDERQ